MRVGSPQGSGSPGRTEGIEISATDLNPSVAALAANAFTQRDEPVMPAADVALIFGVEREFGKLLEKFLLGRVAA